MNNLSGHAQRIIGGLIVMIVSLVLVGVIVPNLDSAIASGTYAVGDRLLTPVAGCAVGTTLLAADDSATSDCDESTAIGSEKFSAVNPILQLLPLVLVVGLFLLGGFISFGGIRGIRGSSRAPA